MPRARAREGGLLKRRRVQGKARDEERKKRKNLALDWTRARVVFFVFAFTFSSFPLAHCPLTAAPRRLLPLPFLPPSLECAASPPTKKKRGRRPSGHERQNSNPSGSFPSFIPSFFLRFSLCLCPFPSSLFPIPASVPPPAVLILEQTCTSSFSTASPTLLTFPVNFSPAAFPPTSADSPSKNKRNTRLPPRLAPEHQADSVRKSETQEYKPQKKKKGERERLWISLAEKRREKRLWGDLDERKRRRKKENVFCSLAPPSPSLSLARS